MYKLSFIDENSLTKLSTSDFIMKMFDPEINRLKELKNLDLSEVDFSGKNILVKRNFDEWDINNVIFSRFNSKSSEKKNLYSLSFKGAKMNKVSFVQAFLDRCNFDWEKEEQNDKSIKKQDGKTPPNLEKVDFFFSEFSYCRFRGCKMKMVDFRYAKVSDCSMNEINVTYGDFYDCNFKGCTAFVESNFTKCSFTNAVFEHNIIREENIKGILQDDINKYREIIDDSNWERYNPCGTKRKSSSDDKVIRKEAEEMYRHLSGIYAGKGLHKDSNAAYEKMKKKELRISWENVSPNHLINKGKEILRKSWEKAKNSVSGLLLFLVLLGFLFYKLIKYVYMNCEVVFYCLGVFILFLYLFYNCTKDCIKKPLLYIWQKIKVVYKCLKIEGIYRVVSGCITYLMGYGYKWVNVIIAYVVLIIIGALFFYYYKFDDINSWQKALNYSYNNIIALQNNLPNDGWKGVLVGFHHLSGVLLIGYLGFIFANKMRNNL